MEESHAEREFREAVEHIRGRASELNYTMHTQYPVRRPDGGVYQLDFAFIAADDRKIAIEIDGHDFHEKTPEQAGHDKKRERFLVLGNWRVLRFTGTEIKRNASICASEVLLLLEMLSATKISAKLTDAVARTMIRLTKKTEDKVEEKRRAGCIKYAAYFGWKETDETAQFFYPIGRENNIVARKNLAEAIKKESVIERINRLDK